MRSKLKRLLLKTLFRPVTGMAYNAIVGLELTALRGLDIMTRPEKEIEGGSLEQLTAMIKTFERPGILNRLVASIKRCYPDLHILVVDDSRESEPIAGVEWVTLPFNSGVSAGRSAGLSRVKTPYMLLLDDDIILYRQSGLRAALEAIKKYPEIDIMGGRVLNLPFIKAADYRGIGLFPTSAKPLYPVGSFIGPFPVYDKVPNFFIARTERLRLVNWDPQLRLIEHADFFTRARGVLATVYNDKLRCLHAKTPFDKHYMSYRGDLESSALVLRRRYYGRS